MFRIRLTKGFSNFELDIYQLIFCREKEGEKVYIITQNAEKNLLDLFIKILKSSDL